MGRIPTEYIVDRGILNHISNMNIKFWAVLDSRGCRKKDVNCHKYAAFEVSFFMFSWHFFFSKNIVRSVLKKFFKKIIIILFWVKIG